MNGYYEDATKNYKEQRRTTKKLIATTVEVALVFQGWVTSGGGEEKTKSGGMQVKWFQVVEQTTWKCQEQQQEQQHVRFVTRRELIMKQIKLI